MWGYNDDVSMFMYSTFRNAWAYDPDVTTGLHGLKCLGTDLNLGPTNMGWEGGRNQMLKMAWGHVQSLGSVLRYDGKKSSTNLADICMQRGLTLMVA